MNRKSEAESFWDLLNHFEDYLDSGIAREHESFVFAKIENDQQKTLDGLKKEPELDTSIWEYQALSPQQKIGEWNRSARGMRDCRLCSLCRSGASVVPGMPAEKFDLLTVTDYPSAEEEREGKNGLGEDFDYLTKWLASIEMKPGREAAVTTVLKCRPGDPQLITGRIVDACRSYLDHQIAVASPKAVLAAGELFLRYFLKSDAPVASVRGRLFEYKNIPVIVTFSPRTVLENPELRRPVWEDLKMLRRVLENRP